MAINKIWKIRESAPIDYLNKLGEFPGPILQLLWNRGLTDAEKINKFLNPSWKDLHDPLLMKNMKEGAGRIVEAIKNTTLKTVFVDAAKNKKAEKALFEAIKNIETLIEASP